MKPQAHNSGATPLAIMQSFVRTLSLEPRYLKHFGEKNLYVAKLMVEIARSMEPLRFNLAGLWERVIDWLPYSIQHWYVNRFVMPGFDKNVLERKILMQQKMLQALTNEGCEQVLIIGPGYDPLAFTAAGDFKKIHFFEVDSGTVRDYKIGTLAKLYKQVRVNKNGTLIFGDNLHLVECDVNQGGLHLAMVNSKFDSRKKTVVFIDELTSPLSKSAVQKLMATLASLLARGSVVVKGGIKNTQEQLSSPEDIISCMNATGFHVSGKIFIQSEQEQTPYYLLSNAKLPKDTNPKMQDFVLDFNRSYTPVFISSLSHSDADKIRQCSPDRPTRNNQNWKRPS